MTDATKDLIERLRTLANRVEFSVIGKATYKRRGLNATSIEVVAKELTEIASELERLGASRILAAAYLSQAETIAELKRENAELDFLVHEGGTWEEQLSSAERRAEAAEAKVERLREALRDYLFAEEIDDPDVRQGELAVARHAAAATLSASKEP